MSVNEIQALAQKFADAFFGRISRPRSTYPQTT